jgi:hypothetical protein
MSNSYGVLMIGGPVEAGVEVIVRSTAASVCAFARPPSSFRGYAIAGAIPPARRHSLNVLNQHARLPDQRPQLPAVLDGFARI